jgi:integrase
VAQTLNKLSARAVQALGPGRHGDGGNLYLVVDPGGSRRWLFIYRSGGKQREMGLGSVRAVSLARARELAAESRAALADGRDPVGEREKARAAKIARVPTFGEVADELLASIGAGFRNPKHRAQWGATLKADAAALLPMPIDKVETADVLRVLSPIWLVKPETASRVRGRIERVLDAAKAKGLRTAENPARWRGHLALLLPKAGKLTRGHHEAMPYADVPAFAARLRSLDSVSARALEFTILTAARSGEVMGARWAEVDIERELWVVPAVRMKAGREHRVPLTARALAILQEMRSVQRMRLGRGPSPDDHVFPGSKASTGLSVMALTMVMRRTDAGAFTVHGFRSTFRDWAGDCTSFPREVAEAALAHTVGDRVEAAYRRSDALERRRELMAAWERHCGGDGGGKVVPLRRAGA